MATPDWQRLAKHVTTRRTDLGLTQSQVNANGGPSVATMRLIEGAHQTNYRDNILGRLEQALAWAPGSVTNILAGGEPTPAETIPAPTGRGSGDLVAELQAIAANPSRSKRLRDWADAQLVELAAIRAANQAEAEARGEQTG